MSESAAAPAVRFDEAAAGERHRPRDADGALGSLFPESPQTAPRSPGRLVLLSVTQVAAVALGAFVLLFRVPGLPSWDTIYGEDYWEFFRQALQQPWHVFLVYNGYEQLVPRVLAQFAAYFPVTQVTRFLTVSGAVVAAACGLFVFHASAGHVRSAGLRALLGVAVVLLPAAPMEIADSGVNTPWYLLLAMFWALLWRPRTPAGMAVAAFVAFAAASSNSVNALFVPMAAARLYALRRPREHAATAGWAAGCLVQIPEILPSYWSGKSRLADRPGPFGHSLAFYAHDVLLPSLGWHLALALEWLAGRDGATVIVAIPLAVVVGAMLATPAAEPALRGERAAGRLLLLDVRHDADPAPGDPDGIGRERARLPLHDAADLPDRVHRGGRGRLRPACGGRPASGIVAAPAAARLGGLPAGRASSRRAGWPTSGTPASAATRPGTGGRSRPSGSTRASASRSGVIVERAGPDRYALPCYHIARYRGRAPAAPESRAVKGDRSQVTDMRTGARR